MNFRNLLNNVVVQRHIREYSEENIVICFWVLQIGYLSAVLTTIRDKYTACDISIHY